MGDGEILQRHGSRVAGCRDLLQHETSLSLRGGVAPSIGDLRLGKASSLCEYCLQMAE